MLGIGPVDGIGEALEKLSRFPSDQLEPDPGFRLLAFEEFEGFRQKIGVEGAAQPLVRSHDEDIDRPFLPDVQERVGVRPGPARQPPDGIREGVPKRPAFRDRPGSLLVLGRGDRLHRLRDLLGVADAPDAPPQVDQVGHQAFSSRKRRPNSSKAAAIASSKCLSRAFLSAIPAKISGCSRSMKA